MATPVNYIHTLLRRTCYAAWIPHGIAECYWETYTRHTIMIYYIQLQSDLAHKARVNPLYTVSNRYTISQISKTSFARTVLFSKRTTILHSCNQSCKPHTSHPSYFNPLTISRAFCLNSCINHHDEALLTAKELTVCSLLTLAETHSTHCTLGEMFISCLKKKKSNHVC